MVGGKAHPPVVQPVRTQINIDLDTIARNIWLPYNIDFIQESGDLSEKPVELDPAAIDDPEIIKEIRLSKEIEQAQLQAEQPPAPSTPSLPTKPNVVMQLVESIDVRPKLNLPVQAEGSSEIIRELILPNENILRTQGGAHANAGTSERHRAERDLSVDCDDRSRKGFGVCRSMGHS
jgi:hypothetical protein